MWTYINIRSEAVVLIGLTVSHRTEDLEISLDYRGGSSLFRILPAVIVVVDEDLYWTVLILYVHSVGHQSLLHNLNVDWVPGSQCVALVIRAAY